MNKRILIIDDDLFIRELYAEILKTEGYTIDQAVDGEEGLTKIQQGGYALILLDMLLPKRNGLDILDALLKNPSEIKNGPIFLLTNNADTHMVQQAREKGAYKCLVKADLTPPDLLKEVKRLFDDT